MALKKELVGFSNKYIKVLEVKRRKGGENYLCQCKKCNNTVYLQEWQLAKVKDCGCTKALVQNTIGQNVGLVTITRLKQRKMYGNCICGKPMIFSAALARTNLSCGHTLDQLKQRRPIEYKAYATIYEGCYNKQNKNYRNLGDRGYKICDLWTKGRDEFDGFTHFLLDMKKAPFNCYSLRITRGKTFERTATEWNTFGSANPQSVRDKVLAFDPGTKNFAYVIIKNGKLTGGGFLQNTVQDISLKKFAKNMEAFSRSLDTILDYVKPNYVILERFMLRTFGTKLIELVSMMIGIVIDVCKRKGINVHVLTSAQWKNATKKRFNLKELYKEGKAKYNLLPHLIDAMCMARYNISNNKFTEEDVEWLKKNLIKCTQTLPIQV